MLNPILEKETLKELITKDSQEVINKKLEEIIKGFNEEDKNPIDFINNLNNFYEIYKYEPEKIDKAEEAQIDYILSMTDAEGNKLFKDAQQARQFLKLSRLRAPNKKYKLPKVLKRDIQEKTPKILSELLKKQFNFN